MSKTKHTPGPWKQDIELYLDAAYAAAKNKEQYAWPPGGYPDLEIESNARLISAAPELLAALEEACSLMPLGTAVRAKWITKANAAIAKAKGGAA